MDGNQTPLPPVKPITATIVAILLALLLTPIPGVDTLFDLLALLFVGTRWWGYFKATRDLAAAFGFDHTGPRAAAKGAKAPADAAPSLPLITDRQPQ